jgi:hypothetical protein
MSVKQELHHKLYAIHKVDIRYAGCLGEKSIRICISWNHPMIVSGGDDAGTDLEGEVISTFDVFRKVGILCFSRNPKMESLSFSRRYILRPTKQSIIMASQAKSSFSVV